MKHKVPRTGLDFGSARPWGLLPRCW